MTQHGLRYTSEYSAWGMMKQRCHNPSHKQYSDYGGRGIFVCDEWRENFINFYNDMGDKPHGTSLDRIDNNKGYYKENCRWATNDIQHRNQRTNVMITIDDRTQCLQDWSIETGTCRSTLNSRYRRGWPHHEVVYGRN